MPNRHETPQPWNREPAPWEPEPSATGRAIIRQWLDHQLTLISGRRRSERWGARHRPPPLPDPSPPDVPSS